MQVDQSAEKIALSTFHYSLSLSLDRFEVFDPRTGQRLIDCPSALPYFPEFVDGEPQWKAISLAVANSGCGHVTITVTGTSAHNADLTMTLTCFEEYVEFGAQTTPLPAGGAVAHWHLLAQDSMLDMYHVHHWRNRHGHNATYETYNLAQGEGYGKPLPESVHPEMAAQWTRIVDMTTFSTDWQFAPRPSFFLAQRDNVMLGFGARDLPHGYGLELRSRGAKIDHLRLNYGGDHGWPVAAGEAATAPRLYLWLDHNRSIWDSVDTYVRLLESDGEIVRRDNRDAPHWWSKPQYCTWPDQGLLAGNEVFYNWMGDTPTGKGPVESFNDAMLTYLLDRLDEEQLNVGSVIIDDGWQKQRGEWVAHPERFPKLRQQIDRIHAMGMKALLWVAPLDFWEGADVLQHPEWLCGGGALGRFGMPMVDFSNPLAQDEYAKPMLRHFFSSDADCLDADGFKSDFMAEKVQPVFPIHDPSWRGEEPFILNTMKLFHSEMRRYKPDGMHLGGICHPSFTGCQDAIRTYDVPKSQLQHEDRAVMLNHFNPGNLVSLDLSECRSLADIEQHIEIATRNNLLYELPRIATDPHSGASALGPDYFPYLRRKLRMWG